MQAPLFLGIEGGGTRTVAVLANAEGQLLQRIETGPANLKLLNDAQLLRLLRSLARQLPVPAAVTVGLAGLRSETDRARAWSAAAQVWPEVPCHVCADLETALAAAELDSTAGRGIRVLVLSGTGSCCFGRDAEGRSAKVGGWGQLLGDKGSAYEIGLRALKAVVYHADVDRSWPRLGQSLLRVLHLNDPEELVEWVQSAGKKEIAALALEVFAAWEQKDKIASDILQGAAHSLVKDATACARQLVAFSRARRPAAVRRAGGTHQAETPSDAPVQFVLAGSVLLKQLRFAKTVSRQLADLWPNGRVLPLTRESVWGAVHLARETWERRLLECGGPQGGVAPVDRPRRANRVASKLLDNPGGRAFAIPEATALSPTEQRNPRSTRLHELSLGEAINVMLSEEAKVPPVLLAQSRQIQRCIEFIVRAFRRGGRLFYVGAGTSGRLGTLDASECPPTFRASPEQIQAIMAGGQQALWQSIEGAEDDAAAGAEAVQFRGVNANDVVIGIAASGRTPFVWGALAQARRCKATTVLVSFNPHVRILPVDRPDLVLAFDLGPEVLTGSTRLKAGTATKLLLNLFTTLSMVRLGKVVSNLMVDLNPSNQKLRQRAVRIVQDLTGVGPEQARRALEKCDWVIKQALASLEQA